MMRVLVACEYSGIVRDEFIAQGHQAISADLLPTERPGPHHLGDVREILSEKWDLIVAHPPCTYLCNSGVRWLHTEPGRWEKLEGGAEFFRAFLRSGSPRICIENPIMHKYAIELIGGRKQTQTIQPYEYGHPESKRTALWLKGLPPLRPTDILSRPAKGFWDNQTPSGANKLPPSEERAKLRAKTYAGIARAMAAQWGGAGSLSQLEILNGSS